MTDGHDQRGPLGGSIFSAEALALAEFLMSRLSHPAIALMRVNFGERFFGEAAGKFILFSLLYFFASASKGGLFSLVLFASFFACMFHTLVIWLRKQRGDRWHSRYPGTPLLSFALPFLPPRIIRRWVEPLLLLFLAPFTVGYSPALQTYMIFSAVSIAAIEALGATRWRRMVLDAQDKQIEAEYFNEALAGKPATQTRGFEIPVGMSGKRGESLKSLFSSLYGETREMIESMKPPPPSAPAQRQTPATTTPDASILCAACNTLNQPNASFCGYCSAEMRAPGALAA